MSWYVRTVCQKEIAVLKKAKTNGEDWGEENNASNIWLNMQSRTEKVGQYDDNISYIVAEWLMLIREP